MQFRQTITVCFATNINVKWDGYTFVRHKSQVVKTNKIQQYTMYMDKELMGNDVLL